MAMARRRRGTALAALLVLAASAALSVLPACLAVTSPYVRPAPRATLSLLRKDDDADGPTPQQVRTRCSAAYRVHDRSRRSAYGGLYSAESLTRF